MNECRAFLSSIVCASLLSGAFNDLHAQDAQFSQFYSTPTYISPAFAGTGLQTRVGLAVRDQWPAFPGGPHPVSLPAWALDKE